MVDISPSRADEKIKVFGIQTLFPTTIMQGDSHKQAVPVLPKMYDGTVSESIGCAPISPIIGSPGYLPKSDVILGHCYSKNKITGKTSNCNSPDLQMTAPSSLCHSVMDDKSGAPCRWTPINSTIPYRQVESNSNIPYGNLLMDAPTAAQYLDTKPEWTTVLNGGGCNYPPFVLPSVCAPGSPAMAPAQQKASCSPTRLKCTYPPGMSMGTYEYLYAMQSPSFTSPPSPCYSINPTTDKPASVPWADATCLIFYDTLTRAFVQFDSEDPGFGQFPYESDLYKPAIFNNIPFNYGGDYSQKDVQPGSYCYRPSPNSCPEIGDIKGKLHGVVKPTQEDNWITAGFGTSNNKQHLLCEYNPEAGKIIYDGPGGFIKNSKDFHDYLDLKVSPMDFFANYRGFPYNDTIYQYIMLEQCLKPVEDNELKDCIGIDGNFGPVLKNQGLKKNPIGMVPKTYWNDAYRLDPMLDTIATSPSQQCVNSCEYRKLNEICAYSPSPCSTCANNPHHQTAVNNYCSPTGSPPISPATVNQYCTTCKQPISYSPDSPRCATMNKSTPDGQECRRWYRQTANNYKQAIQNTAEFRPNPEFSRAIAYNNCLMINEENYKKCLKNPPKGGCRKLNDWKAPCGPMTTAPAVNQPSKIFTPPEEWRPWPPELIPAQIPIYAPGPPPAAVDWEATKKFLHLGSAPASISGAFNRKAKEFCSRPGSKYLWECGCINASAESPANQNHYWNMYNAMRFAPAPPDSKYKEGYFSATKDQEDAKYCWLQPCKYPFGAGGTEVQNLNDPVRLGDLTLGIESTFQNKDMSVCPEFDCESIIITTPDSFIDTTTMLEVMSATGADQICSSAKNSFWIQDPVVCAFGPSAKSLTPYDEVYGPGSSPDAGPPGYVKVNDGEIRDPGNWCFDSRDIYAPASPARKVKWSDQSAYMLEQMCFNGCHNYTPVAVEPQQPQGYSHPTFSCDKNGGCITYLPDSPAANKSPSGEPVILGEFFDRDECKKECMIRSKEEKREIWYVVIIIIAIIAGIFVLLAIRKYLKYKGKVQRYEEKKQKSKTS